MTAFPHLVDGDVNPSTRLRGAPVIDRLMHRTALMNNGCWNWLGAKNPKGYGTIRYDATSTTRSVHRVAYEHFIGPIPADREIDHRCHNRACVNPEHLRTLTHTENVRYGKTNQNAIKTHCHRGHPFSVENTHHTPDRRTKRTCRICARDATRRYRAQRSAA